MPLVFKPASRDQLIGIQDSDGYKNANFKVVMGTIVRGQISPPVADVQVSVQRMYRVALKDRVPTIVYTDAEGKFKHGPTDIDEYEIIVEP